MVGVHVLDDFLLGRDEAVGAVERKQKLRGVRSKMRPKPPI